MNILGVFTSLITFPGVVVHELAHKKFCDWFGIPVYKVAYFRFGNPAGYVMHAEPIKYSAVFWIAFGPLVINSAFVVALSYLSSLQPLWTVKFFVFLWLAFCAGLYAFQAITMCKTLRRKAKRLREAVGLYIYCHIHSCG
jgi:hypothetical protein